MNDRDNIVMENLLIYGYAACGRLVSDSWALKYTAESKPNFVYHRE